MKVYTTPASVLGASSAYYFQKNRDPLNSKTLSSAADSIFRSQRLRSNTDTDTVPYNEIGVKNIIKNAYTLYSSIKKYGTLKRGYFQIKRIPFYISICLFPIAT